MRFHLKVYVAGILVALVGAAANAATLTLVQSQVTGQVAPGPSGSTVQTDPFAVSFSGSSGSTSQSLLTGEQKLIATTANATPPGTLGTTVGGQLLANFRYDGATDLVIPDGAITWAVDAAFSRQFGTPSPATLTTSAGNGINAVMQLMIPGRVVNANARMDVQERIDGTITNLSPIRNENGIDITSYTADENGLVAAMSVPSFTLKPGQTFSISTSFFGNALSNGPVCTNCSYNVTSVTDGQNTGQLSFLLPSSVSLSPLSSGQSLSWISSEPVTNPPAVPLPASAFMLMAGLALLGAKRLRQG